MIEEGIYSTKIFENAVLISLEIRQWTGRKQADLSRIKTDTDKDLLCLSKRLLDRKTCDSYRQLVDHLNSIYRQLRSIALPSFFKNGFYLIRKDQLSKILWYLEQNKKDLEERYLPNFIRDYVSFVQDAKEKLNGLFDLTDYPGIFMASDGILCNESTISERFGISWNIVEISIPVDIDPAIREAEEKKIRDTFQDAELRIKETLYSGLQAILDHLTDRLTEVKGNKRFTNQLFNQLDSFISTFDAKNILDDEALQDLVTKAGYIRNQIDVTELKTDGDLRQYAKEGFEKISQDIGETLEEIPSRKFSFMD